MRFGYFVLHAFFLSRYVRQVALKKRLAETDALTGAFNLRFFRDYAATLTTGAMGADSVVTVALFDLDNFKTVNDVYGHHAGDKVLVAFANSAKHCSSPGDHFFRIGGDEFALVLCGRDYAQHKRILENIAATASEKFREFQYPVSVSVGAMTVRSPRDIEKLRQHADELLYEAKRAGKNKIIHQNPGESWREA